jgi:hypothetical protein
VAGGSSIPRVSATARLVEIDSAIVKIAQQHILEASER